MEEKSFSTKSPPSQSYRVTICGVCNLKETLLALNSLQSNAQAIEQWISARRTNPNADLKLEMLDFCNRLQLQASSEMTPNSPS
jgi:hypothetical protein